MPSRNVRLCFVLYQFDFTVTGSGVHDVTARRQRRNNAVVCSTDIPKWVARSHEANAGFGGKGDVSLILYMLVIILCVFIDIIYYYTKLYWRWCVIA